MKKFFSIFAATALMLSFVACDKKDKASDEPDAPKTACTFKVDVTDITASGALVTITPSDTNAYYYFDVLTAEEAAAGFSADSLAASMKAAVEYYGYQFPEYLSKGVDFYEYATLAPETEYVAYAVQIDENYAAVGPLTTVKFTTLKLAVTDTVNVTGEGELMDLTFLNYGWALYAYLDATGNAYLEFNFDTESIEGAFTEEDFDSYYGSWAVIDEENEVYYPITAANVTGSLNAAGTEYTFAGTAVATNGVLYNVNVVCPVDDGGDSGLAPKKIKAMKFKSEKKAQKGLRK